MHSITVLEKAAFLFRYLYVKNPPLKADLVMGFGHFDPKIPQTCMHLYQNKWANKVLFTGGVGAGTADLAMPEADYFAQLWQHQLPEAAQDVLIENRSTNTGENLRYSIQLWEANPAFKPTKTVLIVANAYRQLRVWATCKLYMPDIEWINCPPATDFDTEYALFSQKKEDYVQHLMGEVERIVQYPQKGFMAYVDVPKDVMTTIQELKKMLSM